MKAFLFTVLFCSVAYAQAPVHLTAVQRVYSDPVSNKAWRLDQVGVVDGRLDDQTGTLVQKADIYYLEAVNAGLTNILVAGSNAFVRAKEEFMTAMASNPPGPSTFISMIVPPYSNASPDNRNPYGLLLSENGITNLWYLSRPFALKPNIVAQDIYINTSGNVVTNYQSTSWVDYLPDATNNPAPHTITGWGRVVRMLDAGIPSGLMRSDTNTYPVIIRDSHLHFGHPEHGMDWGSMLVSVVDTNGVVRNTVTGVYTTTVNNVQYETEIYRGAFRSRKQVGE